MNIEQMARQAGAGGEFWLGIETPPGYFDSLPIFERFADLVLEQAAQKCENHPDGLNMIGGAFVICAEAIRAMKPTQGE